MKSFLFRVIALGLSALVVCAFLVSAVTLLSAYFILQPYYLRAQAYDLKKLGEYNVATIFTDRQGREIGRLFIEDRVLLQHDEIPDTMREAIVAAEDRRFYSHRGLDFKGIVRATYQNIRYGRYAQGASTITQQIAKHLIGRFERTLDRKLVEAFLAIRIEQHYSKSEILDFYLNRIYFGRGYFGLEAAARGYFGKHARDLTLAECATLASIVRAPNTYSPRRDLLAATTRRNRTIRLMSDLGQVTAEESDQARATPLVVADERPVRGQSYFLSMAIKELRQVCELSDDEEIPQGLIVRTTLDGDWQKQAEETVRRKLATLSTQIHPAEGNSDALQSAAVVMENGNGALRVLVGGRDFEESPFDRARMARRENGAVLQPLLYALAFQKIGLTPASMVNSSYLESSSVKRGQKLGLGDPANDLGKPFLTVQGALATGNDSAALRTELEMSPDVVDEWLAKVGVIRSSSPNSGWLNDLSLFDITALYQMLANNGKWVAPHSIQSIVNGNGETIYRNQSGAGVEMMEPLVAQQMTLTLLGALRENGDVNALVSGKEKSVTVAGMSGYSTGYRDAWFVGYTPELSAGVWIGYDKSIPIEPRAVAMSSAPSLWGDLLRGMNTEGKSTATFPIPKGLGKVEVDQRSGYIAGQGFMTPAPGHVFMYLRPEQIEQIRRREVAERAQQPREWSGWLSTLAAGTTTRSAAETAPNSGEIPSIMRYRLPGLRGDILTVDGKRLATLTQSQDLVLSWPAPAGESEAVQWVQARLEKAARWLGRNVEVSAEELHWLYRFQRFQPIVVARNLASAQVSDFSKSVLAQDGFSLQGVPRRVYPEGRLLCHVVGYLQRKQTRNSKQFQAGDVIYEDYRGGSGLEDFFDQDLRGQDGELTIETTPEGFIKRALVTEAATRGNSVRLTIESRIQEAAEASLDGVNRGAVVVINIRNGDIAAMASRPTFNPNEFLPMLPEEKWSALNSDPNQPLLDRTYRQHNPPGSTFKVVTTLAAMRAGVFDPARKVECPGYFQVGNVRYELPRERSSPVSFFPAIAHSFNTYFFDLGLRAGREALISTARDLGLGQPTGFLLPGELSGLIPDDAYVRRTHGRVMGPGDVTNTAIGQGDVLVTPLQMAAMMSAIANGGTLYRPRLVRQIEDGKAQVVKDFPVETVRTIPLTPEQSRILTTGLVGVTTGGTGRAAQVSGVNVASKTGTAQVGSKSNPRQIAWLVGFLPANAPQYAFAIMLEGGWDEELHGGEDAAPVAGKLFGAIFKPGMTVASQSPR